MCTIFTPNQIFCTTLYELLDFGGWLFSLVAFYYYFFMISLQGKQFPMTYLLYSNLQFKIMSETYQSN